jgi:hypothetical protein
MTSILSKKVETLNNWDRVVDKVEYVLNNAVHLLTSQVLFMLLFRMYQYGIIVTE